jgi:hypothetical protein
MKKILTFKFERAKLADQQPEANFVVVVGPLLFDFVKRRVYFGLTPPISSTPPPSSPPHVSPSRTTPPGA